MRSVHGVLAAVLALASLCFGQQRPKEASPLNPSAPPATAEGMVDFLLPDNVAHPERLKEVSRDLALQSLTRAQASASGDKAEAIAYLLVILDTDADANRSRLVESLRTCTRDAENCDERVISYVTDLAERGDKTMLDPLLEAGKTSDSTLVELLGSSYQDMIAKDSRGLITAISRKPAKEQRRLCHMVAAGDGSGLPDDDAAEITQSLQELATGVGPVASTAMMCLSEIKAFVPGT